MFFNVCLVPCFILFFISIYNPSIFLFFLIFSTCLHCCLLPGTHFPLIFLVNFSSYTPRLCLIRTCLPLPVLVNPQCFSCKTFPQEGSKTTKRVSCFVFGSRCPAEGHVILSIIITEPLSSTPSPASKTLGNSC